MTYARVFQSGNSQAVRLPKEFRFSVGQVEIFRRGDEIVLRECLRNALEIFNALSQLPSDFITFARKTPSFRAGMDSADTFGVHVVSFFDICLTPWYD